MTGFTGVVWDTRTTERLAHDLGDGAGPAPLAEAGRAWGAVSTELATAGLEYASIIATLGVHWESAYSSTAFEKLTGLAPWFADTAAAAADNAVRAEAQAAAVSVARLSMPNLAEVDIARSVMQSAASISSLAPAMVGAAAHAERALHDQRMRASRVMQSYESATEPAARPWDSASPAPNLVSGSALAAERVARETAARAAAAAQTPATNSAAPAFAGMPLALSITPEKTKYAPTSVAAVGTPVAPAPAPTTPVVTQPHAPMAPFAPPVGVAAERVVTRPQDVPEQHTETVEVPLAAEAAAAPATWAELAVAETSAVQHAPTEVGGADGAVVDSTSLSLGPVRGR